MSIPKSRLWLSLSLFLGNTHSMRLAIVVALLGIGFSATGASASLIVGLGGDSLIDGGSGKTAFANSSVSGANSVGQVQGIGTAATAYSFDWNSEGGAIAAAGVMTVSTPYPSDAAAPNYNAGCSFSLLEETEVHLSGSVSLPPQIYSRDSSGFHQLNTLFTLRVHGGGSYSDWFNEAASSYNDMNICETFDETRLLSAGDYTVSTYMYIGDANAGADYTASFQYSITPEPSTVVLLGIAAIGGLFAWRRRRQAA